MSVVSERTPTGDLREVELRRHIQIMARSLEQAEAGSSLTMVLRSPASDPAKALIGLKGALQRVGVGAKVIVARLDPEDELRQLFATLSELAPQLYASDLIRWARNPRLLEAHEQVIYGATMSWSGDAMRRDADRRNVLTLFEEDSADKARLGQLAFAALWAASSPVPERYLTGSLSARLSGTYEQGVEAPVSLSPTAPGPQGWPLLRH
ncbi:MAG: hypothetical protein AB7V40_12095 [Methyloceanibacter sp.]